MKQVAPDALLPRIEKWRTETAGLQLGSTTSHTALDKALDDARAGRVHEPPPVLLTVLLLGATGGGKSELLNALAGGRIAKSNFIRPTTSRPTIYAHADVTPARLYEYGSALAEVAEQPGSFITHQREELRHKVLIDAPDIDSFRTEHRDTVMRLLPVVDVVLYVVTPFSYKDDIGWQTVGEQRGRRAFAFVMNKWDAEGRPRVPEGALDVDEDFRALLQRSGYATPRIFRTSARSWVENRVDHQGAPPADDLLELEQWLASGLATNQVQEIHLRRRRSLWGQLAAAIHGMLWPSFNRNAAHTALATQFAALRDDGEGIARPYWLCQGKLIAKEHDLAKRPVSPGVVGLSLRAFGHGRLLTRKRMLPSLALDDCAGASPDRWSVSTLTPQLHASVERYVGNTEWELRQAGVPLGHLEQQWAERLANITPAMQARLDSELLAARRRAPRAWRRWSAIALLTIAELAAFALLGLAAWRVATGFVQGTYTDLPMVLNLIALILFLVLVAGVGMALLFPATEHRVARKLNAAFKRLWAEEVDSLEQLGSNYIDRVAELETEGRALRDASASQVEQLGSELQHAEPASEVGRLFAVAPTPQTVEAAKSR